MGGAATAAVIEPLHGLFAPATSWAASDAPTVRWTSTMVGNVFVAGGPVELAVEVDARSGPGGTMTLTLAVEHAVAGFVLERRDQVTVAAGDVVRVPVELADPLFGHYVATVTLQSAAGTDVATARTTAAVVPTPPDERQPDSPWGIGSGGAFIGVRLDEQQARNRLGLIHRGGIAFTREEIYWDSIEPRQGEWHWERFDAAVIAGRESHLTFLGLLDYWAGWAESADYGEGDGTLPYEESVAHFANYCHEVVSRYKPGGVLAQEQGWTDGYGIRHWEVWNEPPTFWFGTAEQFGQLVKAASAAIRRADPEAFVVVSNRGPTFDQAVMDVAGIESYDALAIHLYPGPTSPEAGNFVPTVQETRAFLDRNGGQRVAVWITELGWDSLRGTSEWQQASYLARANVATHAAGTQRNLVFTFHFGGGVEGWGCVHDDLTPKISYAAYATLTHRLRDLRPAGEEPVGSALRAYLYEGGGRSVAVVWSVDGSGELAVETGPVAVTVYDLMNNEVARTDGGMLRIPLTEQPHFVEAPGVPAERLGAIVRAGQVHGIAPLGLEIAQLADLPTNLPELTLTVTNRINVPQRGVARITLPDGWAVADPSLPFGPLQPGDSVTLAYRLEQVVTNDDNSYPVTVTAVRLDGVSVAASRTLFVTTVTKGTPTVDGDLAEWASGAPVHLADASHVVGVPHWTPHNLSARAWMMWDDENLYVAAAVTDDHFHQPYSGGNVWQGDGIQLFLDPNNDKSTEPRPDDQEIGLSLTEAGPQVWRWRGPTTGHLTSARLAVRRGDNGDAAYELAVPLADLGLAGAGAGTRVGMSFLVNENDGAGRVGWLSWTPGIGNAWDPSQFTTWTFVDNLGRMAVRVERVPGRPAWRTVPFALRAATATLRVDNAGLTACELRFGEGPVVTLTTEDESGPDTYRIAPNGVTEVDVSAYIRAGDNTVVVRPLGRPGGRAVVSVHEVG
jgi:hypothetical protein